MDQPVTSARKGGQYRAPHERSTGLIIAVLVILLIALGFYWLNFGSGLSKSHSRWGQFGDYLGGVLNPAFALVALYLLFSTVRLQSQELRNSVCVLREQSRALQLQNFESTFFQMVRLHHEIVRDIDLGAALFRRGSREVDGASESSMVRASVRWKTPQVIDSTGCTADFRVAKIVRLSYSQR